MIVDKEEAHFLVITPIPDDNTGWLYLLRKTFWIQVAYRVGTTYGQPCFTAKTWRHYIALASLATLCHILRGHIYSTLQFLFISCHTSISIVYYMLVLHASSPNPWQLACRFQSPQRARVMSPQVQTLALPLALLIGKPALSFIS